MKMKNRGVSPVVAEVLLVLLTIAAIGVVAGFVVPFLQSSLSKGTECTNYNDYFKFQEVLSFGGKDYRYNCVDLADGLYSVSIKASADSVLAKEVKGLKVVFTGTGSSKSIEINEGLSVSDEVKMMDRTKTTLEIPGAGELRSYVYASSNNFQQAEVYTVLKSGRTCEKTDTIDLVTCSSSVLNDVNGGV